MLFLQCTGLLRSYGLTRYRPDFEYLLLAENSYNLDNLPVHNLVSAVFRLEKSQDPEDIRAVVSSLVQWLKSPELASIRRAFTVWINRVLLPVRLPGQEVPHVNDLLEVENMLAERVKEWTREWKEEGMQKGMQKGTSQVLYRQLTAKFGSVSSDIEDKLNTADHEQLLLWSERILTANSPGDIFGH